MSYPTGMSNAPAWQFNVAGQSTCGIWDDMTESPCKRCRHADEDKNRCRMSPECPIRIPTIKITRGGNVSRGPEKRSMRKKRSLRKDIPMDMDTTDTTEITENEPTEAADALSKAPRRKVCSDCGVLKPLDDFHKSKGTTDRREPRCKACKHGRARALRESRRAADAEAVIDSAEALDAVTSARPERADAGKYVGLGTRVGMLVADKQRAYGDSFGRSGAVLRELFPHGVPVARYDDLLCVVRILDKLFRIATDKTAFGENPYMDIAGYGLLGAGREPAAE